MIRDLEKDLATCEAATPGPWYVDPQGNVRNAVYSLFWPSSAGKNDSQFIAAARTGWPETILYAMKLEEEIDRLRDENSMLLEALNQRGCRL